MNMQAELKQLRKSIISAGEQCERMLRAANHPLNSQWRDEFLERAEFWSNHAMRGAAELRFLIQRGA